MRHAIYREDGAKLLVEVLSDVTDDKRRVVKIRILKSLREHPLCGHATEGEVRQITAAIGWEHYCWTLTPTEDETS